MFTVNEKNFTNNTEITKQQWNFLKRFTCYSKLFTALKKNFLYILNPLVSFVCTSFYYTLDTKEDNSKDALGSNSRYLAIVTTHTLCTLS